MFHAKRARQDQGADDPISGSTSAQVARNGPAEHLLRNLSSGQPVTVHRRAAARNILVRPGLVLLALAAGTVLGGVLVATASATSQDMGAREAEHSSPAVGLPELPLQTTLTAQANQTRELSPLIPAKAVVDLVLDPVKALIGVGDGQAYTAEGFDATGHDLGKVTAQTVFTITGRGSCAGPICTPAEVGEHTVTGTLTQRDGIPSAPRRPCTWTRWWPA
jgi:hypothetical protein